MALKFKFKSKEEIPAEHLGLYVERDGAFVLDAEGAVEKAKLDEFRTINVNLQKQLTDLSKRFEGIEQAVEILARLDGAEMNKVPVG